jgi:hypothetical protein
LRQRRRTRRPWRLTCPAGCLGNTRLPESCPARSKPRNPQQTQCKFRVRTVQNHWHHRCWVFVLVSVLCRRRRAVCCHQRRQRRQRRQRYSTLGTGLLWWAAAAGRRGRTWPVPFWPGCRARGQCRRRKRFPRRRTARRDAAGLAVRGAGAAVGAAARGVRGGGGTGGVWGEGGAGGARCRRRAHEGPDWLRTPTGPANTERAPRNHTAPWQPQKVPTTACLKNTKFKKQVLHSWSGQKLSWVVGAPNVHHGSRTTRIHMVVLIRVHPRPRVQVIVKFFGKHIAAYATCGRNGHAVPC